MIPTTLTPETIRPLFELGDDVVYMNCAAQGPAPKVAADAGRRAVDRKARPWEPERERLGAEMARSRELFAGFVGASAADIALSTATSYSVAIAANSIKLEAGQTVVVLEGQFPSNLYAWQILAERSGAAMVVVPRPEDGDWTSAVLDHLGPQTGLVALPNVHWVDGGVLDLGPIADVAHAQGAALFIDATQSIGVMPLDIKRLDPDYVACSAYKWLLSPDQCGYLYVAPRRQHGMPVEHNHAGRIGDGPMTLSPGYGTQFQPGARRFDQGAADSMIHVPMAVAAMEQIQNWGLEAIAGAMEPVIDRIADEAGSRGWWVPPKAHRSPHFIGLAMPQPPSPDLTERLAAKNVFVSLRSGRVRVAPYLFTRMEEVDILFRALDREMRSAA
ncbi:MAG: aminotransferase class V-fold PLP-dependent enzyme [Alphaproteobacteria bacterium]|nr:aminotransferase class V-fold PLP-dependent enzyme [Alphaproteobacteria bacterium]